MGSANWSESTRLPAEPRCAAKARAFVCQHLVEHRVLQLVDPVRLVVGELAADAVIRAPTSLTVTLSDVEETVLLTVQHDASAPSERPLTHVMDSRRRVLTIVSVLSRDWGATSDQEGGRTVWATFPRSRAS